MIFFKPFFGMGMALEKEIKVSQLRVSLWTFTTVS